MMCTGQQQQLVHAANPDPDTGLWAYLCDHQDTGTLATFLTVPHRY